MGVAASCHFLFCFFLCFLLFRLLLLLFCLFVVVFDVFCCFCFVVVVDFRVPQSPDLINMDRNRPKKVGVG